MSHSLRSAIKWDLDPLCNWWGIQARWSALDHWWRGHRVHWRDKTDLWTGITGDIWCESCLDIDGGDICIWVREWRVLAWLAARACGALGHPSWTHPENAHGPILEREYCTRCLSDRVTGGC